MDYTTGCGGLDYGNLNIMLQKQLAEAESIIVDFVRYTEKLEAEIERLKCADT